MQKKLPLSLQLTSVIFFLLTACTNATPTTPPLLPVKATPLSTNTPISQPTETVVPTPMFDIGSTMSSEKDGATLIYVPEGESMMGSNDEGLYENQSSDNTPQHIVFLDAFWMDETEVTNKQYAACVSDAKCTLPLSFESETRSRYYNNAEFDDYPVVQVDWYQANAYCEWAGRRLPTEAEWEKAARGTDGRIYPWGNDLPNENLLNYNSKVGDTTKVANYEMGKSPYGVYDMAGNVWEWVNDLYRYDYYKNSPSSNPIGPESGELYTDNARVVRGGSWFFNESSVRSIFRFGVIPADALVRSDLRSWAKPIYEDNGIYGKPPRALGTVGFRCVMNVTP